MRTLSYKQFLDELNELSDIDGWTAYEGHVQGSYTAFNKLNRVQIDHRIVDGATKYEMTHPSMGTKKVSSRDFLKAGNAIYERTGVNIINIKKKKKQRLEAVK